jgi:ubiquitin-protein ligase
MGNKNSKNFIEIPVLRGKNTLMMVFEYQKRINKEIEELMRDNDISKNGYCVEIVNGSKTHLIGKISGPPDTQYSSGIFEIGIVFGNGYPLVPPICKFFTSIWHPNISSLTGTFYSDALKYHWSPYMSLSTLLLMIQSLLSAPKPNTPQEVAVGNQYLNEHRLFDKTAKYWTYIYAMDEENRQTIDKKEFKDFDESVKNLMKAEFISRDESLATLSFNGLDYSRVSRAQPNRTTHLLLDT